MTRHDRASEPAEGLTHDETSLRKDAAGIALQSSGEWPPAIRSAVETAMLQPVPMVVLWGLGGVAVPNTLARALVESLGCDAGQAGALLVPETEYRRALDGASLVLADRDFGSRRFDVGIGPVRDASGAVAGALVTLVETTRLAQAEQALGESRDRLTLAIEAGSGGVFEHAIPIGPDLFVSERWREILGFHDEEMPGWEDFAAWFTGRVHPDDREARNVSLQHLFHGEAPAHDAEFRVRDHADEWTWVREYAKPTARGDDGEPSRIAGVLQDITKRKAAEREAERLAQHDPLTGLPNRALFRDRLSLALIVATEAHTKLGLLIINLDHFAETNERFGHAAGDEVLKTVAERIARELRENDLLARLGSDEFVVIQSDVTGLAGVTGLARRLRRALSEPVEFGGAPLSVSASFGVTVYPDHGTDGTILLRNADLALRKAQEIGPGEIYVFDPAITRSSERRRDLEVEFRRAIERGEMVLHYQPQFDLTTRRPRAVEALVRWRKSESELLHPRHFMSLVTGSTLVVPLGEWILHEAARQARAWAAAGHEMRVAVNVSHGEAARPEFLDAFDRAVAAAGIPSDRIEFEITGAILADHQNARIAAFLEGCRVRGVSLVIDDFGVGYSSSGYLRDLIIEKVKIDLSFVAGVGDEENEALLEIMVDEGHRLGRRVVAEGVENEAQLTFLRNIGCDDAQGNLLCPTGPAEAVLRQLGVTS